MSGPTRAWRCLYGDAAGAGVPDDVYTEAAAHFDERELAQVLSLILTINTWNRVALATRTTAGTDER